MMDRVGHIRSQFEKHKIDSLILTDINNIRYASGFTGSTAVAVITRNRAVILVDSRYVLQAKEECPGFEVILVVGDLLSGVNEVLVQSGASVLGFEADHVTVNRRKKMRKIIDKSIRLKPVADLVEKLRYVKDRQEIELTKKAVKLTDDCFSHLVKWIRPGMTEREVALEIYTFMFRHGGKIAFDSIVAAGRNAAYPHHQPADAVLKVGQMVKLDFGAMVEGYSSDITRTVFLGEPDAKQKEVYQIVLEAQTEAIGAVRPGRKGKEIDSVAREYIKSRGYGEYFGHGLGHSLGVEVHDGVGFSPTSEIVLMPGMIMTVEPGIYIEGWGGVRIEDDILVTEDGCEVLTKSEKEIIVIY